MNTKIKLESPELILVDGKPADRFGTYDHDSGVLSIQSDDHRFAGLSKVILRQCDAQNRLYELTQYVYVHYNNAPEFVSKPETNFTVAIDGVVTYKIPAVKEWAKDHDNEIIISPKDGLDHQFPEFLRYNNETFTITLQPNHKKFAGRTFYFNIMLK